MNKIYFDISDILRYSKSNRTLTGIQRFVTQIISHSVDKRGCDKVGLIAYHPRKKRLICYDAAHFCGEYEFNRIRLRHLFGLRALPWIPVELASYVDDKYGSQWNDLISLRLLLQNILTGGRVFRKKGVRIARPEKPAVPVDARLRLAPGDVIFVGGTAWEDLSIYKEYERIRQSCGVRYCHYVHDLIPIVSPQHSGTSSHQYSEWLKIVVHLSDFLFANSFASARDLERWLFDNGLSANVRVVKLAHQFGNKARDYAVVDGIRRNVLNDSRVPYALCVGVLSARKNVWTLANVWMQLHSRLGVETPRLIFAGKRGGRIDDFDDLIRATGSLYGYIRIIESPSDDELAYLYRNCLFSIFPSYIEGWGLPIGECLWFGRPVICSNSSSMPEVGGDLANYVNPNVPETIVEAVLKLTTDVEYREARAAQSSRASLRTWRDVADDLWHEISNALFVGGGSANESGAST